MAEAELAKLRWRCRRGTRELDGLMLGWLQDYYPQASVAERAAFSSLLDLQDPDLMTLIVSPGNSQDQQGSKDIDTQTQENILRQIRAHQT